MSADEFDRASERDEAIARALAAPYPTSSKFCAHCEEFPRAAGSVNCARCEQELAHEA